jgi:hypothetical protein
MNLIGTVERLPNGAWEATASAMSGSGERLFSVMQIAPSLERAVVMVEETCQKTGHKIVWQNNPNVRSKT